MSWRLSTAARSPRTPVRCCSARPTGRSAAREPRGPVRRSHLGGDDAGQSAATVVRLDGVCSALRVAPRRPCSHAVCRGQLRHHQVEAAERRPDPGERAADQDRDRVGLSLARRIRTRAHRAVRRCRLKRTNQGTDDKFSANAAYRAAQAELARNSAHRRLQSLSQANKDQRRY